jgi:hypothetical protein
MTQWWSYGLSDFLMFSPQAYWRLVARYNEAWWPGQLAGVAASLALPTLARLRRAWAGRALLLLLAAAWAWVGAAFHAQRYAEIFLGAPWLALAFGVQALMLLAAACLPHREGTRPPHAAAWVLFAAALLYPLLAPATGHPWQEAEVFGFLPEPTALATLAALVALRALPPWAGALLALLPLLSLLLGAATRWLIA